MFAINTYVNGWNFSLLKSGNFFQKFCVIKDITNWWNFFMMLKVVNTIILKTTLFVNFITLQPLGLFIITLLVLQSNNNILKVKNSSDIHLASP